MNTLHYKITAVFEGQVEYAPLDGKSVDAATAQVAAVREAIERAGGQILPGKDVVKARHTKP